jgi:hypothetical protein
MFKNALYEQAISLHRIKLISCVHQWFYRQVSRFKYLSDPVKELLLETPNNDQVDIASLMNVSSCKRAV